MQSIISYRHWRCFIMYDGEPEVILAAIELIPEYETVDICETGTILARKDGCITVFNYYENYI